MNRITIQKYNEHDLDKIQFLDIKIGESVFSLARLYLMPVLKKWQLVFGTHPENFVFVDVRNPEEARLILEHMLDMHLAAGERS